VDVWEYFDQKEREFSDLSLNPENDFAEMFWEEEGSHGKRGRVLGKLGLTERAFLEISEVVVIQNNHVHREEYAYFLVIDGAEVWGEERDLSHKPAVHRHVGPDHERHPAEPISFRAAAKRAWDEVSDLEEV
jgi:hypothetical protein